MKISPYETHFGRVIPPRALRIVAERIAASDDCQNIITDELRDFIPVHEEDLDEAMEVFNHCEDIALDLEGGAG